VIEKGSGKGSLEQAVDDIKTFANTASFLANKLVLSEENFVEPGRAVI